MSIAHILLLTALTGLAPAHTNCLIQNPVTFTRGSASYYDPRTASIQIAQWEPRVVVHEYGHHIDISCGAEQAIGDQLRAAQKMPPGKPWAWDGPPVSWPAEYFANAVLLNAGYETRHNVTPETVHLVKTWLTETTPTRPYP